MLSSDKPGLPQKFIVIVAGVFTRALSFCRACVDAVRARLAGQTLRYEACNPLSIYLHACSANTCIYSYKWPAHSCLCAP